MSQHSTHIKAGKLIGTYLLVVTISLALIAANYLFRATDPEAFAQGTSRLLQVLTVFTAVFVFLVGPPSVFATTRQLWRSVRDDSNEIRLGLVLATVCEIAGMIVGLAGLVAIVFFGSWVSISKSHTMQTEPEGVLESMLGIEPVLGIDGHAGLVLLFLSGSAYLLAWIIR